MDDQTSEVLRRVDEIEYTYALQNVVHDMNRPLDHLKFLCAALRTALKDTEWQNIKTAPKDGSRVLIGWFDTDGVWQARGAYWDAEFEITGHQARTGKMLYRAAWTDGCVESFGYEETKWYEPTHWATIPSPPATNSHE